MNLQPCAHCGGEGYLYLPTCKPKDPYNPRDRLFPWVYCKFCYTEVPGDIEDYVGITAVEKWNLRHQEIPEITQDLIDAYMKAGRHSNLKGEKLARARLLAVFSVMYSK